ncbi:hypothetical protein Syun_021437 [Stephania yunnanensis]|uniref:Uncharacterized protein n=1 Tax=Stephania yunnanensis TaxID=152371 RepID=A0AAP0NR30_9MAGN
MMQWPAMRGRDAGDQIYRVDAESDGRDKKKKKMTNKGVEWMTQLVHGLDVADASDQMETARLSIGCAGAWQCCVSHYQRGQSCVSHNQRDDRVVFRITRETHN